MRWGWGLVVACNQPWAELANQQPPVGVYSWVRMDRIEALGSLTYPPPPPSVLIQAG